MQIVSLALPFFAVASGYSLASGVGSSPVAVARVHRGAVLEERLGDLTMAESRREMKGRATIGSGRVDRAAARRPAFEERNERSRVPLSSRLVEFVPSRLLRKYSRRARSTRPSVYWKGTPRRSTARP